jgi:hypothetical protein
VIGARIATHGSRLTAYGFALAALAFALTPARAFAQDAHLLVITGVAGDEEHTAQFHKWATAVVDAAKKSGLPDASILYLGDQPEQDPARIRARSTRENVAKAFTDVAAESKPGDDVVVLLIGHGSFDGHDASFNLPGPDMTAGDFGKLLDKLSAERVTFINTASSSGAFVDPLKRPGRVIVTSTKTGGEKNEPVFAQYFAEALTSPDADRDRNGRVSMQEAFDYAQTKVKAYYDQAGTILTEHATLEDGSQGKLAGTVFLAPDKARAAIAGTTDPELRALLEQQSELERQVAVLRLKKESMDPADYDKQLEKLLTDLALKTKEVRDREANK